MTGAVAARRRRPGWATGLSALGELLITAGLVVLLLVVYELWITGIFTHQAQNRLEKQFATSTVAGVPPFGHALAILYSPRLGKNWKWVVVEGVATADLAKGPGHYPQTVLPGRIGNFSVAGHRTTHGAPFYNTDKLRPGDAIVVETKSTWYVYRVTGTQIVAPTQVSVVDPVPDKPGVKPTRKLITFTACNPLYSATQRLIVHGALAAQSPRANGPPAALRTGKA